MVRMSVMQIYKKLQELNPLALDCTKYSVNITVLLGQLLSSVTLHMIFQFGLCIFSQNY